MSTLLDYTKEELLAYAEEFGVDVKPSQNKATIVAAFEEDGVTVELITGFHSNEEEDEEAPVLTEAAPVVEAEDDDEDLVLVKMIRTNHSYEIRGYRFTREHPFALVSEDNADYLIETDGGFRMASPKEARTYYS